MRVLILGAGLISRPIARYLLALPEMELTVGSLLHEDARLLIDGHPRGTAVQVDVTDEEQVDRLIGDARVVVSLVPYAYHVTVARLCIRHRAHLVTTSYVSPEMQALDGEARAAGVLLLNETGLDPGIDHMSAMRVIHRVRDAGGEVVGFRSCCGGLPAPEASDNPWRYKFSWSPRGALLAAGQPARFRENGAERRIPADELFSHGTRHALGELGVFEVYPNRDSLRYLALYDLHDVREMFRGTFRYPGWCESMRAVTSLGLLDPAPRNWPDGASYADFLAAHLPDGSGPLDERLARRLGVASDHPLLERFRWIGLLDGDLLPDDAESSLDVVAARFGRRLAYAEGERDMVVLEHRFEVERPGAGGERIVSRLVQFGEPGGDSATSRTVSLPAAIATRRVLEGGIALTGVQVPVVPEIYDPLLDELETLGIRFDEHAEPAGDRAGC